MVLFLSKLDLLDKKHYGETTHPELFKKWGGTFSHVITCNASQT